MITLKAVRFSQLTLLILMQLGASVAFPQSASVNEIPLDSEQKTTITIEKGTTRGGDRSTSKGSEVLEGTAEVTGDPKPLARVARESWAKACEDWKKEVKELNKEVIVLNCNKPICANEGVLTICRSTATYKILVKIQ